MTHPPDNCPGLGMCHARPLVGPGQDRRSRHDRFVAQEGYCPECDRPAVDPPRGASKTNPVPQQNTVIFDPPADPDAEADIAAYARWRRDPNRINADGTAPAPDIDSFSLVGKVPDADLDAFGDAIDGDES